MEVVKALLSSRSMSLKNVTQAVAYFRNIADASVLTCWSCENHVALPVIVTECDICRDELLFEIELQAIAEREHRPVAPRAVGEPKQRAVELVGETT
jgi:hypothetical protein